MQRVLTILGFVLTGLLLGLAADALQQYRGSRRMGLEEWGSFIGGVTAGMAFIWLVVGYFLHSYELKQNTRMLQTQAEALEVSVRQTQQLVESAIRQAKASEMLMRDAMRRSHPRFVHRETRLRGPDGGIEVEFENCRAPAYIKTVEVADANDTFFRDIDFPQDQLIENTRHLTIRINGIAESECAGKLLLIAYSTDDALWPDDGDFGYQTFELLGCGNGARPAEWPYRAAGG